MDCIDDEAAQLIREMGPTKSLRRYEKAYKTFLEWQDSRELGQTSVPDKLENRLMVYFGYRKKELKAAPSTVWPLWSQLKQQILVNENINILPFVKLRAWCKENSVGEVKKATAFTEEQVHLFLTCAPDNAFFIHKVSLILHYIV